MKTKSKKQKKQNPKPKQVKGWPLERENYLLFGLGFLILIIGYFFLAQGPWDSFWSRTLAPIILVLGYCVIIPLAIIYGKRDKKESNKISGS